MRALAVSSRRCGQRGTTLVELMVVLIIMGIVSTMILGIWFTLSRSYADATESSEQRDDAQLAMERMTREIRDVQATTLTDGQAISPGELGPYKLRINTTFNMENADNPGQAPQLVEFRLQNGTLFRTLAGADRIFGSGDDRENVMVRNVVNAAQGADLFQYYFYNGEGDMVHSSGSTNLPPTTARIKAIKISILVDLRPGSSPEYMKLTNTVQPRNQRNF